MTEKLLMSEKQRERYELEKKGIDSRYDTQIMRLQQEKENALKALDQRHERLAQIEAMREKDNMN